ncbi:MAG: alpha/beta fold hydrolase [Alphaproteobacteria bacterium]|nr:alpha/beta fold hydrolase [Alphaproteobacteria bacterium]MBL6936860.1 alpha/beta fold hydrolase [Alphaproteobacteria bacterium]MBL7097629.1 alpha/beta fold hydrolase [Alphaproteobacteria bacterium]
MRSMLIAIVILVLVAAGGLAATIMLSAPAPLPRMMSVSDAFAGTDFSGMPARSHFTARDGTRLDYRAYPGDPGRVVVLVHGSSGTSASMHLVAKAIHAKGATVYALAMRGHDGTGRSGDVDYIGQLDDDVVDFMKTLGPRKAGETRTLLGFSSGGGFALRFAGGPNGALFDRLILVSPQLPHDAPTSRANAGGWVSVAIPRIVGLSILTRLGITTLNGLPVLRMAVNPDPAVGLTPVYSYRMLRNFGPSDDYLGDVKRAHGPVMLFVGEKDEIFRADQYAPLLKPVRPDLTVTVVPGLSHMEMTTRPPALDALAAAARG